MQENRSVLQRFLDNSILSFELRNRIYSFSGALYHKEDSFVIPGVFHSFFFLDLELLYKTSVIAHRSHSKFC